MAETIDAETKLLAAMAYGEASPQDDEDEIYALASVLVRQRDARGYSDMAGFTAGERTFSFVVSDGNVRFHALSTATAAKIASTPGMATAIAAAKNALAYGPDRSNGAYFWDGADIKVNYSSHFKVRQGVKITDPAHNVYDIADSTRLVIKTRTTHKKVNGKRVTEVVEIGRFDHVYESTAGHGGTIFWKFNPDYVTLTHSKEYK